MCRRHGEFWLGFRRGHRNNENEASEAYSGLVSGVGKESMKMKGSSVEKNILEIPTNLHQNMLENTILDTREMDSKFAKNDEIWWKICKNKNE